MARSVEDIEEWARAYVEAQKAYVKAPKERKRLTGDDPFWWAVERFMELIHRDGEVEPEDCWKAILRILELDPEPEVIAILAAGPLEDLINHHGPQFIDRIEAEARRNSKFRYLLGGVWESSTPEIWARVEACRGRSESYGV